MKKLFLALILLSAAQSFAQISDIKYRGILSGTCANTFTTCSNQPGQPMPNTMPAATSVEVPVSNYGMASVTISGSYTGVTINFEFSDDGGITYYQEQCTRTDSNIVEVSEAVADNSSRSWDCTVAGSGILRVRQSANSTGKPLVGITLTSAAFEVAPTMQIASGNTLSVQGPTAVGSADASTTNGVQIAGINIAAATNAVGKYNVDSVGDIGIAASIAGSDGISNSVGGRAASGSTSSGVQLEFRPQIFNGTTWDRLREIPSADAQARAGFIANGIMLSNGSTFDRMISATGTVGVAAVNTEGTKTTYRLAGFVTPGAAPTDVINLQGSGTKTVRILRIAIHIESTAGGISDVVLIRRSTANSGGTSSSPTIGKMATADAAATAVDLVYTANPATPGTTVANLGACKVGFVTSGSLNPCIWDFTTRNGKGLVLSGTSDFLSVNGNGDTLLTGEAWAYDIEWTEE